ncbi:YDG/SRA domain-containing protein [Hymenobacter psychrophilus]|uniref:SAD/SRA domain-containing protein n=1 Tax=Hymenobacter psychrophilus TaxID=651662 RepID=A0A1H3FI25_9BACT|nr:YDG/SRA domain-containing protein [Hymenobacter psychrophilus]SDX89794.1 SAD/SRA domain-containing protein [Hymenobacter psychrophilus]
MPHFGHVSYYRPGDVLDNRLALSRAGLHRPTRTGVSGSAQEGAESIILADQYADDDFREDDLTYSGSGGRDPRTGRQTAHQEMSGRNLYLNKSLETGRPVRVFRRITVGSGHGYRYEGLYRVVAAVYEAGKAGFLVWKFRLVPE